MNSLFSSTALRIALLASENHTEPEWKQSLEKNGCYEIAMKQKKGVIGENWRSKIHIYVFYMNKEKIECN